MLREKAEKYANALQTSIGDKWKEFRAIRSHKHQTWIIMSFFKYENIKENIEYTTEEEIIYMLINRAKKS